MYNCLFCWTTGLEMSLIASYYKKSLALGILIEARLM